VQYRSMSDGSVGDSDNGKQIRSDGRQRLVQNSRLAGCSRWPQPFSGDGRTTTLGPNLSFTRFLPIGRLGNLRRVEDNFSTMVFVGVGRLPGRWVWSA